MKVIKILIVAAVLIAAFTPLWTQPNVETLTVDTLCDLSKTGGGEAQGALFLPDGNIIAIWKGRPMIIDSKSGEIIRNLDALPSGYASDPKITKDGSKLITRVSGPELAIWDIPTGKIIKQFKFQVGWCCISPDGTKMFLTLPNKQDNLGTIVIYDMATFEEIDRLAYPNITWGGQIDISPDGQTLAVSVGKTQDNQYDTKANRVILINLNDKKNYTIVETFEPQVYSMEFSPDGKRIAFLYNSGNDIYIYIYNLETKEKKYIRKAELSALFGGVYVAAIGKPQFIDNNIIYTGFTNLSGSINYTFTWDITRNKLKNYINFNPSTIDIKDSLILFGGGSIIGLSNKYTVPVRDIEGQNDNYLTYNNNQLELYSDIALIGNSTIYDTTGKLIANLGTQPFVQGKNIIRIDQQLLIGVYILTIKDKTNQFSYKFMVE